MADAAAGWLDTLERRHLADLTLAETARALRALSSCYVERRSKLASGDALGTRGKRAAFALFYGPLHFLVIAEIIRRIPEARENIRAIVDVGCGTGAAGAAWYIEAHASRIDGSDRSPWAVTEANWTYRELNLNGRAIQADAARFRSHANAGTAILVAYTLNELSDASRDRVQAELLRAHARGARALIVEPIAKRMSPWWTEWQAAFEAAGGRSDEWRFPANLPPRQRELARAAGLDPRELTARTLWL